MIPSSSTEGFAPEKDDIDENIVELHEGFDNYLNASWVDEELRANVYRYEAEQTLKEINGYFDV